MICRDSMLRTCPLIDGVEMNFVGKGVPYASCGACLSMLEGNSKWITSVASINDSAVSIPRRWTWSSFAILSQFSSIC
jgi:hypothetical protein